MTLHRMAMSWACGAGPVRCRLGIAESFALRQFWSDIAPVQKSARTTTVAVGLKAQCQPGQQRLPHGVWDTFKIHDWQNPVQRTQETITYTNESPSQLLPNIVVGFRKMDNYGGASVRFDAVAEPITASTFSIGVEQWSDSIFYGSVSNWHFNAILLTGL